MTELERSLAEWRARVQARDEAALRVIAAQLESVWNRVHRQLEAVLAAISAARDAGRVVDQAWLAQEARLEAIQRLLDAELYRLARTASAATGQRIKMEAAQGVSFAGAMASAQGVQTAWRGVPMGALEAQLALLDTTAVQSLFFGSNAGQQNIIRSTFAEGVTLGWNPARIAAELKAQIGLSGVRMQTISRTETLRALRAAAIASMQANQSVVPQWLWSANLGPRTCAACWALNGSLHPVTEPFASHPNCRCAPVPWTGNLERTGAFAAGAALFAKAPVQTQMAVLGPGRFRLYREEKIVLADLITYTEDAIWGRGVHDTPLRALA